MAESLIVALARLGVDFVSNDTKSPSRACRKETCLLARHIEKADGLLSNNLFVS
jgi:hypothetical protein